MAILEKMCQNLKDQGINATPEAAKTGVLETLNPFDRAKNLGNVILQGSNIASINLEGIYESATQSGSAGTRNVLRLASVDLDYVLSGSKFTGCYILPNCGTGQY